MFCFDFCFPKAAEAVNSKMPGWHSSKLLEYVDSLIFHEIWLEHSLTDKEQKASANTFIFTSLVVASNATHLTNSGTWQIYKKITNRNKRECWWPFRDWCIVINTSQFFCINDRISYPINSLECQLVFLELTTSSTKQKSKQNIILSNSTLIFITFLLIYSL